jgi:probable DNA repair protein
MTTVTYNTRLARLLQDDFNRTAPAEKFWEVPDILPWRAWIRRLWDEAVYSGKERRVILSGAQEQLLWEQVIRKSPEASDLLNPTGTAKAAMQAWQLLHAWRLPRLEMFFADVPDTAAFFEWTEAFQATLTIRGFVTEAEVPELLLRHGFPAPGAYAGFDELTPVQRSMFEGADEIALAIPVMRSRRQAALPDAEQELRAAASWSREQLELNPAAKIGVVFPDLTTRRTAAQRIFEETLGTSAAFHISAPVPLSEVPMVADLLLVLKLCSGLTLAETGRLLRSPYFPHSAQDGARTDVALRRRGVARVTLSTPEISRLFPRLEREERSMRPSEWSQVFSRTAVAAGWPGPRTLSSDEFQALEGGKELLSEFSKLDPILNELDFRSALATLQKLAQDTGFGPENEAEPVQIMGVLEAAGSRFDALWIGGLHDGAWPPPSRPNPFLPLSMQRSAGIPNSSVEQQFAFAKRTTARLLRSADQVICSYPQQSGEEALRPSPMLSGMQEVGQALLPADGNQRPAPLEELIHDPAPPLGDNRYVKGGMSVIADQSACPFKAFAKHRLGARGLDEVEPGLTDQERGNVTHNALEAIWNNLRSRQALLDSGAAELRELVESSIRKALDKKLGEASQSLNRIQELEVRRLSGLLLEWLQKERARPDFEVRLLEEKQRYEIGGLELDIRVDRVDRYSDGSHAILDYKTGKSALTKQWEKERPEAPQLPLYSIMMEERVSTVAFAKLVTGKLEFLGISETGDSGMKAPVDLQAQIAAWRIVLESLAVSFVTGDASVDPTAKACQYCDLKGLCRVAAGVEGSDE